MSSNNGNGGIKAAAVTNFAVMPDDVWLGVLSSMKSQPDLAIKHIEPLVYRYPFDYRVSMVLGILYFKEKKYNEAYRDLKMAAGLAPDNHFVRLWLDKVRLYTRVNNVMGRYGVQTKPQSVSVRKEHRVNQ